MTQTDIEPEIADLSDLLEGLIAKPLKHELAAHLEEVENCFKVQRKRFTAQFLEVQDLTKAEAMRLRSKLDDVATGLRQLSAQAADDVAADRNRATQHLEVLQDQFAVVLESVAALASEQQAFREEARFAIEAAAAKLLSQMEQEKSARHRQTRSLALLASCVGLLGAGAIELLHLLG